MGAGSRPRNTVGTGTFLKESLASVGPEKGTMAVLLGDWVAEPLPSAA